MDDWGGLENRCGLWATVGSNLTHSAEIIIRGFVEAPLPQNPFFHSQGVVGQLGESFDFCPFVSLMFLYFRLDSMI